MLQTTLTSVYIERIVSIIDLGIFSNLTGNQANSFNAQKFTIQPTLKSEFQRALEIEI